MPENDRDSLVESATPGPTGATKPGPRAAAALEAGIQQDWYRSLFEQTCEAVYLCDLDGNFIDANPAALALLGYTREDIPRLHFTSILPQDQIPLALQLQKEVIAKGSLPHMIEFVVRHKTGHTLSIETTASLLYDNGIPRAIQGIARDISERRRLELTLSEQAEFERLVSSISTRFIGVQPEDIDSVIRDALSSISFFALADRSYVFFLDRDRQRLRRMQAWTAPHTPPAGDDLENLPLRAVQWACHGQAPSEIIHIPSTDALPPEARPERQRLEAAGVRSMLLAPLSQAGRLIGFLAFASLARYRTWSNHAIYILKITGEIFVNALETKRITETLRESEEKYRLVTETAREIIATTDLTGRIDFINRAGLEITGYTEQELLGTNVWDHLPDFIRERYSDNHQALVDDLTTFHLNEAEIIRKDRTLVPLEISISLQRKAGRPTGVLFIARDITERKKAEEDRNHYENRLRQSQKLEAIGTLAGGIAHDFNNILSAIINYTELLKDNLPPGSLEYAHLEEVLRAGDRATELIKQILTFSRQMDTHLEPVSMPLIVKESLKLIRASLPSTIEILQDIDPSAGVILGDATHIQQLIINLCTNAYHAMENGRGLLGIALKPVRIDSNDTPQQPVLKKGSYIRLTVSDTGLGMDMQTKERIFDPFFTTKKKGTGLGLAMVHGIVTALKGTVTVYSEPGMGSTFKVLLPAAENPAPQAFPKNEPFPAGQGEHILLVDDEPSLLKSSKQMLQRLGYQVATTQRSDQALELFRRQPQRYDLVITDQTMPVITGIELAQKLLAIKPDLPIILCTGFSESVTKETARDFGITEFLLKPAAKTELAQSIRRALDHTSRPAARPDIEG